MDSFLIKHGAVIALSSIAGRVPDLPAWQTHRLTEIIVGLEKPIHEVTLGELQRAMAVMATEFGEPFELPEMVTLHPDSMPRRMADLRQAVAS
ncbi:MAG: hypothetical protein CMQ34_09760 [Gammaproteobacteria bacterium]|nr:hypothetical protein [Gammaproteobacteria bacterium]|tara:strand:+ start:1852 stop:2130 length:279 start_codon:yes stop_codon:yes gene_type:complete